MNEIHIAEIGGSFDEHDELKFLSDQNLYEFDFIIVDTGTLIDEINGSSLKTIEKKINDLKDFIARKNIPVVFFFSVGGTFALSNGNESSIPQLLGLEVEEEKVQGKKIEIKENSLFTDFLDRNTGNFEYKVAFVKHPGVSIGNAKSKSRSVGFYTKDFIFLPTFGEDAYVHSEPFLNELYQLAQSVRRNDEVLSIPSWVNNYFLPGEETEIFKLEAIKLEIARLEAERLQSQQRLLAYSPLKQLWTATGLLLENAVKQVFVELGFTILESEPGRDDLKMEWKEQPVIVEVKGQNKSAAEKNAAQLEKWASNYFAEEGVMPKGLLIVNTFRELPLEDRIEKSFPEQMLPYCINRNHCLITTLQLSGLLLACRNGDIDKDILIEKLLTTNGRYEDFEDWKKFLSSKVNSVSLKRKIKKTVSK